MLNLTFEKKKHKPMLRVTVMMFRDMVESVTLLKEEAWKTPQMYFTRRRTSTLSQRTS